MAVLSAVAAAVLSVTTPMSAADAGLSFDPATVRFGYADGYWDNDHRWHGWPNAREAREFHRRFRDRIYGYRHTRYPNDGWREDGVVSASARQDRRGPKTDQ
jgi:hypothetical protein